jgi:hypothetical protein
MNALIRKLYALPGVWQLWSIPVLASVFTSGDLRAQAKSGQGQRPYLLFMALAVVELAALAAWFVLYLTGRMETVGSLIAGGVFLVTGLALVVTALLYAKRRKPAFRAFLVEQGFGTERPELLFAE